MAAVVYHMMTQFGQSHLEFSYNTADFEPKITVLKPLKSS